MGFDRALVLEVFFACNKNEELAANYLLDHIHEFEDWSREESWSCLIFNFSPSVSPSLTYRLFWSLSLSLSLFSFNGFTWYIYIISSLVWCLYLVNAGEVSETRICIYGLLCLHLCLLQTFSIPSILWKLLIQFTAFKTCLSQISPWRAHLLMFCKLSKYSGNWKMRIECSVILAWLIGLIQSNGFMRTWEWCSSFINHMGRGWHYCCVIFLFVNLDLSITVIRSCVLKW